MDSASAEKAISSLGESLLRAELHESAQSTEALGVDVPDQNVLRRQVLDRIPRYKSWLQDIPEYYCVGHDGIENLVEPLGLNDATPAEVSFLFAGCGDGRNLFSAIASMMVREVETEGIRTFSKMHATILDLKPAALARVLIFFNMMVRFDTEFQMDSPGAIDPFLDMAYLFSCQIIPPYAEDRLQSNIKELIKRLESEGPVLPFIYVRREDRGAIVRVLRQWQHPWDGVSQGADLRAFVKLKTMENGARTAMNFGQVAEHGSQQENDEFDEFTVLFPPMRIARRREPLIADLVTKYRSTKQSKELLQYLDTNWKVNNTLIDYDFANRSREQGDLHSHPLEFHPLEVAESMSLIERTKGRSSIGELTILFRTFTTSVLALAGRNRLVLEVIAGEMADIMERIRYNLLDYRVSSPAADEQGLDPTTFPQAYDYVHMSNIPDYIGGHLTAFLAGRPLLKEGRPSSLRFSNLLNPPEFANHNTFQSEYLLMYDMQRIRQHFLLTRRPGEITEDDLPPLLRGGLMNPFAFEDYMIWDKVPRSSMSAQQRLPKSEFEKWIYGHLLKICLPCPRPVFSGQPVYAPLNLTALIRLAVGMFEVGYPADWVVGIFSRICAGVITTSARPPTKRVYTPAAVDASHPAKEFNIQPWVAEFTTLLSVWRHLLPFGSDSLNDALVPLGAIVEYSITFPKFPAENERLPHFMLLFCDAEGRRAIETRNTVETSGSIYSLLLEGSRGGVGQASAKDVRETGIVCVTAFNYTTASRKAVFWMRADTMQKMMAGEWTAFIWRTDAWRAVTEGVSMGSGVAVGPKWTA